MCISTHFDSIHHQWQMMAFWVEYNKQATAKQQWALQQPTNCEFRT
jgi:hypothetical protein